MGTAKYIFTRIKNHSMSNGALSGLVAPGSSCLQRIGAGDRVHTSLFNFEEISGVTDENTSQKNLLKLFYRKI
ncbi:hypothetical protein V7157_05455 [Neobacillus drentensis]|uniref:hypothetical protein n=1 Tax=Neobacillus drentensis TaxID=220684 RepID=UPI003000ABD4